MPVYLLDQPEEPDHGVPTEIVLRQDLGGYIVVWSDGVQTIETDLVAALSPPQPELPANRWNMG